MLHRKMLVLSPLLLALGAAPASAQLFGDAPARTIVLSPGWHLNGAPVRSSSGLHVAVRSDAGVLQDMTVLPNGAITFSPHPTGPSVTAPAAKSVKQRKPKPVRKAMLPAPVPRPALQPQDAQSPGTTAAPPPSREEARVAPAAAQQVRASAPTNAAVTPAKTISAAPPQPVPTGPGFAHGVPINPLD